MEPRLKGTRSVGHNLCHENGDNTFAMDQMAD